MANWRTHEYVEFSRSANERAAPDGSSVLRTLDFLGTPDYQERLTIRRDFLGYAQTKKSPDLTKTYISRVTPHFLPYEDGQQPTLWAHAFVHSEQIGASGNSTSVRHATGDLTARSPRWRATIEYKQVSFEIQEDGILNAATGPLTGYPDEGEALKTSWTLTRFVSRRREPGGRTIPIKSGLLKLVGLLDGSGHPIPTAEPIPLNEVWQPTWYQWTCPYDAYPAAKIQRGLQTVNDAAFDGHPRGTLLFIAVMENIHKDPFGQWLVDVSYKMIFTVRMSPPILPTFPDGIALGHNALFYPHSVFGPRYFLATSDGNDDPLKTPFGYTNFADLFRPVNS